MVEQALNYEHFNSVPRPKVISGHVLLGRSVLKSIDPEHFSGNTVLMNLSNQDLYRNVRGAKKLVRKQTQPEDIVDTVLKVTHGDLSQTDTLKLYELVDNLFQEYRQSIDLADKDIAVAIEERMPKIADTDLMRGMSAFSEAEYDQHQGSYEYTLLTPARRLAGWMILRETEIDHV